MNKMIFVVADHSLLDTLCDELKEERLHFTYWDVKGVGKEVHISRGGAYARLRIEIIVEEQDLERVKKIIMKCIPEGIPGAGIIAVYNIEEFIDLARTR